MSLAPTRSVPCSGIVNGSAERLRAALYNAVDAFIELLGNDRRDPADQRAESPCPPGLVAVPAAAELLGVSTTAVRRFVRTGGLPSVRIGRRVLFRREVLARFAADHEHVRE